MKTNIKKKNNKEDYRRRATADLDSVSNEKIYIDTNFLTTQLGIGISKEFMEKWNIFFLFPGIATFLEVNLKTSTRGAILEVECYWKQIFISHLMSFMIVSLNFFHFSPIVSTVLYINHNDD